MSGCNTEASKCTQRYNYVPDVTYLHKVNYVWWACESHPLIEINVLSVEVWFKKMRIQAQCIMIEKYIHVVYLKLLLSSFFSFLIYIFIFIFIFLERRDIITSHKTKRFLNFLLFLWRLYQFEKKSKLNWKINTKWITKILFFNVEYIVFSIFYYFFFLSFFVSIIKPNFFIK